ncbi:CD109 antigen-like [Dreissena polymorpha]|uniref:CD109 antigen-like n=1 Tax=Dreissena polymorpha TaxID=45954 RepID=UPI002265355F|nr:CD109 antigen-like [Dreissena polymorpha]
MDQQTPGCRPGFRLPGLHAIVFTLLSLNLPPPTLGTYYVSLPRSFTPGYPLDLYVQVTNANSPVICEAAIVDDSKTTVARTIKTIISGKPDRIRIDVPDELPTSRYVIAVTGTGGLAFYDEAHLHYEQDVLVLIQTDKTRYSARQKVLYRAIFLQSDLTNFRGNASISIYDGKNNRIKLDGPRKISHGVIEGHLDISTEPVFGEWKIQANVLGLVKSKFFKVFDYVLPRFNVELVVPNEILTTDGTIGVAVKARFTFNTDVHGTCTVVVYQENDPYHYFTISKQIQGSVNFTIYMSDLIGKGITSSNLKVRATVTDNSTLVSFATEKDVVIHEPIVDRFELHEIIQRHGFVNGLNYTTFLKLTNNGQAPRMSGILYVFVTYYSAVLRTCQQLLNHYDYLVISKSSFNGQTTFGENGIAEVTIPVEGADIEKIELTVRHGVAELFTTLYSMSKTPVDMLTLTLSSAELQVGNAVTVTAESSTPLTGPVILEVFCRNRRVQFDSTMASGQTTIRMTVSLTEEMAPFSYIIASHITSDRRILLDSAYVQVDGTMLKNKVQVTYNTTHTEPGQFVDMKITADPYSAVYVMVGDERNRLLGSENDIFSDEVINGVTSFAHNPEDNSFIYNQEETKPGNTFYSNQYGPSISQTTGVIILTDGSVFNRSQAEGLLILGSHPNSCPYPPIGPFPGNGA